LRLCERSPLPLAISTENLPWGQIQVIKVCKIQRIDCHPAESDEDGAPESISDIENWLYWASDFNNAMVCKDDWEADKHHLKLDNGIDACECPHQQNVSATPNVPRMIQRTQMSMHHGAMEC
jgi:hypothetical protein